MQVGTCGLASNTILLNSALSYLSDATKWKSAEAACPTKRGLKRGLESTVLHPIKKTRALHTIHSNIARV